VPSTRINRIETLIGFILVIAGADLAIMFSKLYFWVGFILLAVGVVLILDSYNILKLAIQWEKLKNLYNRADKDYPTIGRRIIKRILYNGRYILILPIVGVVIILFVISYNIAISPNPSIGTYDIMLLFLGTTAIIYPYFWEKFAREMDFVLLFATILAIELIPIMIIIGPDPDNATAVYENPYVKYMLVLPLVAMMQLSGIDASHSGSMISFTTQAGDDATVAIAISCSGIYSFMIFLAAFFAFVFSFYYRFERKIALLLAIGATAAYLANLLRMYIVMLAGYFNGVQPESKPFTLLWTHKYAGELIFVCWIALFWWLTFRYFAPDEDYPLSKGDEKADDKTETVAIDPGGPDAKDF